MQLTRRYVGGCHRLEGKNGYRVQFGVMETVGMEAGVGYTTVGMHLKLTSFTL